MRDLPFTTFRGNLKRHAPKRIDHLFNFFFSDFVGEEEWRKTFVEEGIKGIVSAQGVQLTTRGRERRYAGDRSLERGRYSALWHSSERPARENVLISELFAYVSPSVLVQPEVLDSTVDSDQLSEIRAF